MQDKTITNPATTKESRILFYENQSTANGTVLIQSD